VIAHLALSRRSKDVIKFLGSARLSWCALGLTAFLFLFAQAPRTRLTTDPVLYAGIARTMVESGDYVKLRLGDEPYYNKPPLQFWLAAAAINALGPTILAVTLFSRLFALGCVLLTVWLGARLYGAWTGWVAGLALTTSYIFFRGSATFRLDSAMTFGILLALYAYLSSPKKWAPPVFYLGVAIALLSKGPPGLLPLFIAPVHAFFSSPTGWRTKGNIRWVAWSVLLLLPLSWWLYLFLTEGGHPFHVLFTDLMRSNLGIASRLHAFWTNYILLAFLSYYWPWLPFAVIGTWLIVTEVPRAKNGKAEQRASAALLLAWVGLATLSSAFKNAQYPRYVFFALPAVSIVSARGFTYLIGEKYMEWVQGSVAAMAIIGAFIIAGFPATPTLSENEQYYAIEELLSHRLEPAVPVPMLKLKRSRGGDVELSRTEKSAAIFFFNRPVKLVTLDEVREASAKERITVLLRNDEIDEVKASLPLELLFTGPNQAVAEVPRQPSR
jgi:4-amino-4-deoxy-L-arabinose transferase-like glycosyltransferase